MNIHNISTISRYETKLLRRSWLFRIFAIFIPFSYRIFSHGYTVKPRVVRMGHGCHAILHPVCQYLPFQYRAIRHCHILGRELLSETKVRYGRSDLRAPDE